MKTLYNISMILTFVFLLSPANAQTYQMTIVSGDHQYVARNNASEPLKVKVTNNEGVAPPVGSIVVFAAPSGHRMKERGVATNSEGVASATFIAGSRTETVSIEANFFNISTQTFTARIVAPITHYVPTNAAGTSNVWKKFRGFSVR